MAEFKRAPECLCRQFFEGQNELSHYLESDDNLPLLLYERLLKSLLMCSGRSEKSRHLFRRWQFENMFWLPGLNLQVPV